MKAEFGVMKAEFGVMKARFDVMKVEFGVITGHLHKTKLTFVVMSVECYARVQDPCCPSTSA